MLIQSPLLPLASPDRVSYQRSTTLDRAATCSWVGSWPGAASPRHRKQRATLSAFIVIGDPKRGSMNCGVEVKRANTSYIPDRQVGALGIQNDLAEAPKPLKEKTIKVERRALQEAQRAAKVATKEAGGGVPANTQEGKSIKPSQKKDAPQVTSPSGSSEKKVVDLPIEKDLKKDVPPPRMQFDDKHKVEKVKRRAMVN